MSDDDDSFIILGSTPNASMDYRSPPESLDCSMTLNGLNPNNSTDLQVSTNTAKNFSLLNGSTKQNGLSEPEMSNSVLATSTIASRFLCSEVSRDEVMQASVLSQFPSCNISNMNTEDLTKMQNLISDNQSLKDNLEKSNMVLKRHFSMIKQYQSEVQTKQEEIQALNNKLTAENLTLKKQIIDNAEKYNAEIEVVNAAHQKQINEMKLLIDKYEEENEVLNQELIDKAETFKINYETMRQENDELVKQVSDKLSIIQNLSCQLEKMELEKNSFVMLQPLKQPQNVHDFISKVQHDSDIKKLEEEKTVLRNKNIEYDDALNAMRNQLKAQTEEANYLRVEITTAQEMSLQTHNDKFTAQAKEFNQAIEKREAEMKTMRHDLSELKVKNIQFEDMIQEKSEEIERLRGNLQNALDRETGFRAELARLEADKLANQKIFVDKETELKGFVEQIGVLEAQLQIYKNDFESERKAREEIAGEKEQIMTDLSLLQKRHQELLMESQQRLGQDTPIFSPSTNGNPASVTGMTANVFISDPPPVSEAAGGTNDEQVYTPVKYMCPICNVIFKNFVLLNHHVQDCLNTAT